jgi:hypothetical protein
VIENIFSLRKRTRSFAQAFRPAGRLSYFTPHALGYGGTRSTSLLRWVKSGPSRVLERPTPSKQTIGGRADPSGKCHNRKWLLLDHLVAASEQRWRNLKAKRLRGLRVDDEFEFGRLLDREVRWRAFVILSTYSAARRPI